MCSCTLGQIAPCSTIQWIKTKQAEWLDCHIWRELQSCMLKQQRYNQPNRELHIFWIARPILPSVHAQSITRASFFLASISCHPSTNSPMYPPIVFLSSAYPSHLNRKCSSFSTSPMVHCLQILSSFFSPFHLPVSTLNSAVPPLNLASILRILLLPTSTHRDWHPPSNRPFTTPNFDRSWISASQTSLTIYIAASTIN